MRQTVRYLVISLGVMLFVGCAIHSAPIWESIQPPVYGNTLTLEKFGELWNIIVNDHPSALPDTSEARLACFQKVLAVGIESCLNDPFSHYLSKEETTVIYDEIRGSYAGVGLELDDGDTSVEVTSIIEDSPAERSGMFEVGDVLIEVNGEDVSKKSRKAIMAKVRGSEGTEVSIRVKRKDKKLDPIKLIRKDIWIRSVRAFDIDEDITYIKIDYFNKLTPGEFMGQMSLRLLFELSDGRWFFNFNAKMFIYDLRGNSGGLLEAVGMMSYLFADGNDHIVITEQSRKGEKILHARYFVSDSTTVPVGILKPVKSVLIINEATASAAEIFAEFVHEATGAVRVGKRSYGKGSVQRIFSLEDDDALYLTIAEYFVGNQKVRINKIGIQPEYEVDNPKPDKSNNSAGVRIDPANDPQLKKAIELLREPRT